MVGCQCSGSEAHFKKTLYSVIWCVFLTYLSIYLSIYLSTFYLSMCISSYPSICLCIYFVRESVALEKESSIHCMTLLQIGQHDPLWYSYIRKAHHIPLHLFKPQHVFLLGTFFDLILNSTETEQVGTRKSMTNPLFIKFPLAGCESCIL